MLATATAAVLVIIAFIPAVQTWVAQMELTSRLGVQGTTQTEILQGVAEGDAVVLATASVVAGQTVTAAVP